MLTNEQMEKLWWKYKEEGVSKNLSLQAFCSIHSVPYNAFEKYLKLRRHFSDVHHITITDVPEEDREMSQDNPKPVNAEPSDNPPHFPGDKEKDTPATRIMVSIQMTNGIRISKRNMNYQGLRALVEKLEVLC